VSAASGIDGLRVSDQGVTLSSDYAELPHMFFSDPEAAALLNGVLTIQVPTGAATGEYVGQITFRATDARTEVVVTPEAASKTYDGTTDAVITGATPAGLPEDGSVALEGAATTGAFATPDAGDGIAVVVDPSSYALTGADAYQYTLRVAPGTADIAPRTLTVDGLTADDKEYDATASATFTGAPRLSGAVPYDDVALFGAARAAFETSHAGNGLAVEVTGYSLDGEDADNYTLAPLTLTADITPRTVVLELSKSKVYDGDNGVAWGYYPDDPFLAANEEWEDDGINYRVSGLVDGQVMAFFGPWESALFLGSANAGTYDVSAMLETTLVDPEWGDNPPLASDYVLDQRATVTIEKAPLTLDLAAQRQFDGTIWIAFGPRRGYSLTSGFSQSGGDGTTSWSIAADGILPGEDLYLWVLAPGRVPGSGVGAYSGAQVDLDYEVDSGKTGLVSNYRITVNLSAEVVRKPLQVLGVTVADKEIGDAVAASLNDAGFLEGVVNGYEATATAGTCAYSSTDRLGDDIAVDCTGWALTSGDEYYDLQQPAGVTGRVVYTGPETGVDAVAEIVGDATSTSNCVVVVAGTAQPGADVIVEFIYDYPYTESNSRVVVPVGASGEWTVEIKFGYAGGYTWRATQVSPGTEDPLGSNATVTGHVTSKCGTMNPGGRRAVQQPTETAPAAVQASAKPVAPGQETASATATTSVPKPVGSDAAESDAAESDGIEQADEPASQEDAADAGDTDNSDDGDGGDAPSGKPAKQEDHAAKPEDEPSATEPPESDAEE
jgi:hypothetical protein